MAKRGVKPRLIKDNFLEALNHEENPIVEWDDLFHLQNWLEAKGASAGVVTAVEGLIAKTANTEILAARNIIDDLIEDIKMSFGPLKPIAVIKLLKALNTTKPKMKELDNIDLGSQILNRLPKITSTQTKAIGQALAELKKLPKGLEVNSAIKQLHELNKHFDCQQPNPLGTNVFERLRTSIGVHRESATEFITNYLWDLGDRLYDRKILSLSKGKGKPVKFPAHVTREEISHIEIKALEKLLKGGLFNPALPVPKKKSFVKYAFFQESMDFIKTLPVSELVERPTPLVKKEQNLKLVTYKDKSGKVVTANANVTTFEAQKMIKVPNPRLKPKKNKTKQYDLGRFLDDAEPLAEDGPEAITEKKKSK